MKKIFVLSILLLPTLSFSLELSPIEKCIFWGKTADEAQYFLTNFKMSAGLVGIETSGKHGKLLTDSEIDIDNPNVKEVYAIAVDAEARGIAATKLYNENHCEQYLSPMMKELDSKK